LRPSNQRETRKIIPLNETLDLAVAMRNQNPNILHPMPFPESYIKGYMPIQVAKREKTKNAYFLVNGKMKVTVDQNDIQKPTNACSWLREITKT